MIKNPRKLYFILILIFFVYMANLIIWEAQNKVYFNYDSLRYYLKSLYIYEELKNPSIDLFFRINQHLSPEAHPLLAYFITSLFYFFISSTQNNATLINTSVFLIILLVSLYKLGKLIKNEYLGVLACIIILFYPVIFTQTKIYMLDFPLLSMLSLSVYFLIRSENFKNKKYSFLFAISAVLGMLIKFIFLAFILAPFIYSIFRAIKKKCISLRSLLFISTCLAMGGLIYFITLPYRAQDIFIWLFYSLESSKLITAWCPPELHNIPFFFHKIRGALWYIWGFINWQAGFLFFLLFLWGLFKFTKSENIYKRAILVWLGGSYLALSWFVYGIDIDVEVTAIRYSMPLLIPICLITTYGILDIKRGSRRTLSVLAILIYGIANSLFLSYPILKNPIILRVNINQDKYHLLPSYINLFSTEPLIISGSNWSSIPTDKSLLYKEIEEIFFKIAKFYKGNRINVVILSDNSYLWHLKYLSFKYNKDIHFICDYTRVYRDLENKGLSFSSEDIIMKADFVIKPIGGFKAEREMMEMIEELEKTFETEKEYFEFLERIDSQEFTLYLYRNKNQ